jgi:hypothetical protein
METRISENYSAAIDQTTEATIIIFLYMALLRIKIDMTLLESVPSDQVPFPLFFDSAFVIHEGVGNFRVRNLVALFVRLFLDSWGLAEPLLVETFFSVFSSFTT